MALRQAIKAGNAFVLLEIRDRTARGLRNAARSIDALGKRLAITGIGLTIAGTALTKPFVTAVREFAKFEQLVGRFNQVFKNLSGEAESFANTFSRSINESRTVVLDQLATFQSFFLGLGAGSGQALELSKRLTKLTNDFVAFDDSLSGPEEALQRLLSVLTGETEAAKRLRIGLDIREANLAKELETQYGKTARSATQLQKTLAILNLTFRSASLAGVTGQAVREVDTLAARLRGATGAIRELFIEVGAALEQDSVRILRDFTQIVRGFQDFVKENRDGVVAIAKTVTQITALGAALTAFAFALPPAAAAAQLLAAAITVAFANPFTLAGTAIAALIGSLVNFDSVVERAATAFEGFGSRVLRLVKTGDIETAGQLIIATFEKAILEGLARLDREIRQAVEQIKEGITDGLFGKDVGQGSFAAFTQIEELEKKRLQAGGRLIELQKELERATSKAEFGRKFFSTRDAETVQADIEEVVASIGEISTELARLKEEGFGETFIGRALESVTTELDRLRGIADQINRGERIVDAAIGGIRSGLEQATSVYRKGLELAGEAGGNKLVESISDGVAKARSVIGAQLAEDAANDQARLQATISSLFVEAQQEAQQLREEREATQKAIVDQFIPAIRTSIGGALAPLLFGPFGAGNLQKDILNENKKQTGKLDDINRNIQQVGFAFAPG